MSSLPGTRARPSSQPRAESRASRSRPHNYLLAQFFTPELNRRTDRWRAGPALLLAVVEAVRRSAPELALGVRLSADSAAATSVAPLLADRVDYLSVALGESSTYRGSSAENAARTLMR